MSIISTNPVPSFPMYIEAIRWKTYGKDERGRGQGKGEEEELGGK